MCNVNNFLKLPNELVLRIFSFLGVNNLLMLRCVDKRLKELANDCFEPWKNHFNKKFPEITLGVNKTEHIINFFKLVAYNNKKWKKEVFTHGWHSKFNPICLFNLYLPIKHLKDVKINILESFFCRFPLLKKIEFEGFKKGVSQDPTKLLIALKSTSKEKIKELSLSNNKTNQEGLLYFCNQAKNLEELSLNDCSIYIDSNFLAELLCQRISWKSLSFVGSGRIDDSAMEDFLLSYEFSKLKFLKISVTELSVSRDMKAKLMEKNPALTLILETVKKL